MEILIERNNIRYLRRIAYQKAEIYLQGQELRIHLYQEAEQSTVFVMIEPATQVDLVQVRQWLIG